jgi:membrane protease YdiL (CAAX protease family)
LKRWSPFYAWAFVFCLAVDTVMSAGLAFVLMRPKTASNASIVYVLWMLSCAGITLAFSGIDHSARKRLGLFLPSGRLLAAAGLAGWAVARFFLICLEWIEATGGNSLVDFLQGSRTHFNLLSMVAPPFEELIFRGYFYPALRVKHGICLSLIQVTVFTLLMHINNAFSSVPVFFCIVCVNILLCLIREKYSNLFYCVAFHLGYNGGLL